MFTPSRRFAIIHAISWTVLITVVSAAGYIWPWLARGEPFQWWPVLSTGTFSLLVNGLGVYLTVRFYKREEELARVPPNERACLLGSCCSAA
jgi:hypothetical protein